MKSVTHEPRRGRGVAFPLPPRELVRNCRLAFRNDARSGPASARCGASPSCFIRLRDQAKLDADDFEMLYILL
jgi:hypothetical protein